MDLDKIWNILNSDIVILMIGSGLGFSFVKFVWEPYKQREARESFREAIKNEVNFRLLSMVDIEERLYVKNVSHMLDGGVLAHAINPIHKNYSLHGLIFMGWGKDILKNCLPNLNKLNNLIRDGDISYEETLTEIKSIQKNLKLT
jgi:hypothetical protein